MAVTMTVGTVGRDTTLSSAAAAVARRRPAFRRRTLPALRISLVLAAAALCVQVDAGAPTPALTLSLHSSSVAPRTLRPTAVCRAVVRPPLPSALRLSLSSSDEVVSPTSPPPRPLKVAIVGAGPSGLLLAHRLLASSSYDATVSIFEARPDPRAPDGGGAALAGRAYALGLNGRTRSAVRSVGTGGDGGGNDEGESLWEEIKTRGFESDKFVLRAGTKFKLKLRDGPPKLPWGFRGDNKDDPPLEPSVLIYQSDLCAALLDTLEERYGGGGDGGGGERRLNVRFDARVNGIDAGSNFVRTAADNGDGDGADGTLFGPFDVLAGCGGVNSPVRTGIQGSAPPGTFECETRALPGTFKVARLANMPPMLDADAVTLLLPSSGVSKKDKKKDKKKKKSKSEEDKKKGSPSPTTAFVEPVRDGGACILFAGGRRADVDADGSPSEQTVEDVAIDPLLAPPADIILRGDRGALAVDLRTRFPLLAGGISRNDLDSIVNQLLTQRPARASSVRCNAYHYKSAVLCGDAAHATGGVSGQGVNSAFVDSKVLADCLDAAFEQAKKAAVADGDAEPSSSTQETVRSALLAYSQNQVPEGWALYDLSFGAEGELSVLSKLRTALANARDTVFGGKFGIGKPVLQVQLSSTLRSFADIRRRRDRYYGGKAFPDQEAWDRVIAQTYDDSPEA